MISNYMIQNDDGSVCDCALLPFDLLLNDEITPGAKIFYCFVRYLSYHDVYDVDFCDVKRYLNVSLRTVYNYMNELQNFNYIKLKNERIVLMR